MVIEAHGLTLCVLIFKATALWNVGSFWIFQCQHCSAIIGSVGFFLSKNCWFSFFGGECMSWSRDAWGVCFLQVPVWMDLNYTSQSNARMGTSFAGPSWFLWIQIQLPLLAMPSWSYSCVQFSLWRVLLCSCHQIPKKSRLWTMAISSFSKDHILAMVDSVLPASPPCSEPLNWVPQPIF